MIAAVRRARSPGCKFDQILVTESPEGWNKSSAWKLLAGEENFSDADILGKDARAVQEELKSVWIHEIADLAGLTRAEVEHVKAFASRTNDRARGAYERFHTDQPRQSIEVGTTNAQEYLLSMTGNRRFWTVKLRAPVDLARLGRDRAALWGEAAAMESAGETLVLPESLWGAAGAEQEKRRVIDTWEDELEALTVLPGIGGKKAKASATRPSEAMAIGRERIVEWEGEWFISNTSINDYLTGKKQPLSSYAGRKIAEIMRKLGWERCEVTLSGRSARGYKKPAPLTTGPKKASAVASVAASVFEKLS